MYSSAPHTGRPQHETAKNLFIIPDHSYTGRLVYQTKTKCPVYETFFDSYTVQKVKNDKFY